MCSAFSQDSGQSDSGSESDFPLSTLAEVAHTDQTIKCKLCFRPAQAPEDGLKLGPLYSYGHLTLTSTALCFPLAWSRMERRRRGSRASWWMTLLRSGEEVLVLSASTASRHMQQLGVSGEDASKL